MKCLELMLISRLSVGEMVQKSLVPRERTHIFEFTYNDPQGVELSAYRNLKFGPSIEVGAT